MAVSNTSYVLGGKKGKKKRVLPTGELVSFNRKMKYFSKLQIYIADALPYPHDCLR